MNKTKIRKFSLPLKIAKPWTVDDFIAEHERLTDRVTAECRRYFDLKNKHANVLSALKNLMPHLDSDLNAHREWQAEIEAARIAIERAEGGYNEHTTHTRTVDRPI